MSEIAIKVENLAKQYRLGTVGSGTLSHDLNRLWAKLRGKEDPFATVGEINDRSKPTDSNYVWALQNINFQVKRGEVLGIIGKNGAGKSTLLKILSRITSPTSGIIGVNGRIGSLLEVGTGFHPELTGRENIFLNGAILGMRHKEINKKLEEIVAFSGVSRYLDTPVKRYSSGMKVRLGFAVAAHLEPEILIVDEVLAVGDADFQKKCLGRLNEASKKEGRTVLFVSHNLAAISNLCPRSILLENGEIVMDSDTGSTLERYLDKKNVNEHSLKEVLRENMEWGQVTKFEHLEIRNSKNDTGKMLRIGEPILFTLRVTSAEEIRGFSVVIAIQDAHGNNIVALASDERGKLFDIKKDESKTLVVSVNDLNLNSGRYYVRLGIRKNKEVLDLVKDAGFFDVEKIPFKEELVIENLSCYVKSFPCWSYE